MATLSYTGVKRAHLLDARLDGGLLLELYSRDGVGTMISADFYEGHAWLVATLHVSFHDQIDPLEGAAGLGTSWPLTAALSLGHHSCFDAGEPAFTAILTLGNLPALLVGNSFSSAQMHLWDQAPLPLGIC
eukprot:scaffold54204_cov16-Tisochrysis_lutea.AAC.3